MRLFKKRPTFGLFFETCKNLYLLDVALNDKMDDVLNKIDCVNRRIDGDEMFFNVMIRTHVDMMHKAPKKPIGKKGKK